MWLFLLPFLFPGQNGAMQDKAIRPIGKNEENGTMVRCFKTCLIEGMFNEKQTETDRLEQEKAELEGRLRRLEGNSSLKPPTKDVSNLDENSEQNDAVPGMQDYGQSRGNGTRDRCLKKCVMKAMVTEKQTEVEKLNKEKAVLEGMIDRLKQWENTILLMGGNNSTQAYNGMIVLAENRTKWTKLQLKLPYSAEGSGAVSLNGEIYIIGGWKCPACLHKLGENLEWIPLANMNIERMWITNSYVAWNGSIWVFGGQDEEKTPLKSVERYDPKENKWTVMPNLIYPRVCGAVAALKDRIIITGGQINKKRDTTRTVECFYPPDGRWKLLSNMSRPLATHSLVSYKNNLITMGGWDEEIINQVWKLASDDVNAEWEKLPAMKYRSDCLAGIALDNKVYAIGGRGPDGILSRVQIFDGEQWEHGPSLPYPLHDMSAVIISQQLADRLVAYRP